MNTLEQRLKEFEAQRAEKKDQDKLEEIFDAEIRGILKMTADVHPNGAGFESIRKRLVKRLSSQDFLKRVRHYIKG